jgi:hypothetical protein
MLMPEGERMTVPYWGRILPTQIHILRLAGHVLLRAHAGRGPYIGTDEERLESMAQGRSDLVRSTGQDFGYDLRAWHDYLTQHAELRYDYGYGGDSVPSAVETALTDSHHIRLARILEGRLPLDPSWITSTVVALARGIRKEGAFDRLPILADALQDAGCDSEDVLNHCRGPGPHVRGCWVVDLVLGKS